MSLITTADVVELMPVGVAEVVMEVVELVATAVDTGADELLDRASVVLEARLPVLTPTGSVCDVGRGFGDRIAESGLSNGAFSTTSPTARLLNRRKRKWESIQDEYVR